MPKMKTHRGSAKRFKKTGSGKLKTFSCIHKSLIRQQISKAKA